MASLLAWIPHWTGRPARTQHCPPMLGPQQTLSKQWLNTTSSAKHYSLYYFQLSLLKPYKLYIIIIYFKFKTWQPSLRACRSDLRGMKLCYRPGSQQDFGNLFWAPHSLALKAVFHCPKSKSQTLLRDMLMTLSGKQWRSSQGEECCLGCSSDPEAQTLEHTRGEVLSTCHHHAQG